MGGYVMNEPVKSQKTRREQRQLIVELLYQMDLLETLDFEHTSIPFVDESVQGVLNNLPKIDAVISAQLVNYTIKRLSYVDRAIIRFAVYELYFTETPIEIVIDEGLKLTRLLTDLGDNKSVAFNNKVIDKIHKALKG